MGGRVYDAEIGRFLSADPFVQDSTNLQGLNRYSYVENNPLSYTDPSGYFLKSLFKKIGKAIKNAVSAVVEFERELRRKILRAIGKVEGLSTIISVALNFIPGCQGWCSMAFSAAMTDANGGTIGQMFTGAAIGFVMHGLPGGGGGMVGAITKNMSAMARTGVNLVAGGVSAKAQGGKFIDGMKGAAVGMGLTAVGMGIRESVTFKTDLVSEIGNEFRILFATKPPAEAMRESYTMVEQVGDGAPMTVANPAAVAAAPPNGFYRVSANHPGGGFAVYGGAHGVVGLKRGQDVARWAVKSIGYTASGFASLGSVGLNGTLRAWGTYGTFSAVKDFYIDPSAWNATKLGIGLFTGGLAQGAKNTTPALLNATITSEAATRLPEELHGK